MAELRWKGRTVDFWAIENELYEQGRGPICGVDEAGAGPLAGPVFAAAVILPRGLVIDGLNDSKKLSEQKREKLFEIICEKATGFSITSVCEKTIDEINILNARMLAMDQAIKQLEVIPDLALIDGDKSRGISLDNRTVIGGDGKCASIAAASILAKVSRDRYMCKLAEEYPQYGFEKHKGYGTKAHYAALRAFGACPAHRRTFLKKEH